MRHREIFQKLSCLAPYEFAEEWDPTGPMLGNLDEQTINVLISLDLTSYAYQLAIENECNLIITHHPFVFEPLKSILADNFEQNLILKVIQAGISVISCHTNLDAATNGVAVSFLSQSLLNVPYDQNTGILIPNPSCHDIGHGRIIKLIHPIQLNKLISIIDHNLKTRCQINTDRNRTVEHLCFTPGAFDESWISSLQNKGVEVLITGEIKHHVTVMLEERGIAVIATGHGASEQTIVPHLKHILSNDFPKINFVECPGIVYNLLISE